MAATEVPRPKAPQILVDKDGRATKEFQWYLYQLWLRTGGANDAVAGALTSGNNLSDVASSTTSRQNLGFDDPVLDKASPGNIGATAPGTAKFTTITGTSVTLSGTLTVTGKFDVDASKNVVVGSVALGTGDTDGFLYIPTMAGAPTGTPTTKTGTVAIVYNTSANTLNIFNGSWRSVALI